MPPVGCREREERGGKDEGNTTKTELAGEDTTEEGEEVGTGKLNIEEEDAELGDAA